MLYNTIKPLLRCQIVKNDIFNGTSDLAISDLQNLSLQTNWKKNARKQIFKYFDLYYL